MLCNLRSEDQINLKSVQRQRNINYDGILPKSRKVPGLTKCRYLYIAALSIQVMHGISLECMLNAAGGREIVFSVITLHSKNSFAITWLGGIF